MVRRIQRESADLTACQHDLLPRFYDPVRLYVNSLPNGLYGGLLNARQTADTVMFFFHKTTRGVTVWSKAKHIDTLVKQVNKEEVVNHGWFGRFARK